MKFSIGREEFLQSLQQTVGVAEKKTTMPILANILLQAKDKTLTLTATDLEVCLINSCDVKIEREGSFTLPAKSLFDIVKEFPRDNIELELTENNQVELRAQKSLFRLVGMAAEDFPAFPEVKNANLVRIPANDLRMMIESTSYSISSDEMRYSLNGILFESVENASGKICLRLVSTDGHRLSMAEYALESVREIPFHDKTILPKKKILKLKHLLNNNNKNIKWYSFRPSRTW
jgi:DNA polymerase-3 subunit beta